MEKFYCAQVDETETTFNAHHYREDLKILTFTREQTEGNFATATCEIKNPYIGLLSGPLWVWISWQDANDVVTPLFFGRLAGIPTNILLEVCKVQFTAQPLDYLERQQIAAELLKVAPQYDAVWLDAAHRDDPNSILEGYPMLWHTDPVTHVVSPSDILVGEAGIIEFQEGEAFYDSVSLTVGKAPLQSVNVDATVKWTQSDIGIVPIGQRRIKSATGNSLVSEWPKPDTSIGGGWEVHSARAVDLAQIDLLWNGTFHQNWQSREDSHIEGDAISWDFSLTAPEGQLGNGIKIFEVSQPAHMDPFDPDSKDITTAWDKQQFVYVGQYDVATSLVLRYDAARARTERVIFTLQSNLQPVITQPQSPPLPSQETITLSGQDVGERLINVLDWLSVKGQAVEIGQVVYPNQPTVPGGTSFQMAIVAGVAGNVPPTFSPVLGQPTIDGGVTWVSLGTNLSTATPDWAGSETVSVGTVIRPLEPLWATWADLNPPPNLAGATISVGEYVMGGGALQVCTVPGTTGLNQPGFGATWGATTIDGSVTWVCIGPVIADGGTYYVATVGGTTNELVSPPWNPTLGATFTDGTVTWKSLGDAGKFVDIPIGEVLRRSYFTLPRGLTSIENLICRARAKLLLRARCVEIKFETTFERGLALTLRHNVRLFDHRLPGGVALGKVTSLTLTVDGDTGDLVTKVTMMCAVGLGNTAAASDGIPSYVDEGYVDQPYQFYISQINVLQAGDVGYTVPADTVNDDGLIFPLTADQVVIRDEIIGTAATQKAGIDALIAIKAKEALLGWMASVTAGDVSLAYQAALNVLGRIPSDTYMRGHEIFYELDLKPVNGGPFNGEYTLLTTLLEVPKQIDTQAGAIL